MVLPVAGQGEAGGGDGASSSSLAMAADARAREEASQGRERGRVRVSLEWSRDGVLVKEGHGAVAWGRRSTSRARRPYAGVRVAAAGAGRDRVLC